MNSLTGREKKMLYFLLCFLIVMGGIFLLVMPAINRYQESSEQLEEKRMAQSQMELSVQNLSLNQKNLEQAIDKLLEEKSGSFSVMTNQDIDRAITGMVSKHLPISSELEITTPVRKEIVPYDPESKPSGTSTSAAEEEESDSKTWISQVKLKSAGNLTGLLNLVAEVNEHPSIRIVQMKNNLDNQTGSYNVDITFELFMME